MAQSDRNTTRNSHGDNVIPFISAPPIAPVLSGGAAEAIETDERHAFTVRALMAMASDVVALQEAAARVATQFRALADEYGVFVPEPEIA
jgi:hypothetical protein